MDLAAMAGRGPWVGVKPGFRDDLRRVWPLVGLVAVVFQVLPQTLLVAIAAGHGPDPLAHISGRLPVDVGSVAGVPSVVAPLAAALVLTLVEEIVFRVVFQERLSWYVGTPAAIVTAAVLFGLAHAVGATGNPPDVALDVSGVMLDGVLFGLIYARTHNLLLTWTTHYAADVVGAFALLTVFRVRSRL